MNSSATLSSRPAPRLLVTGLPIALGLVFAAAGLAKLAGAAQMVELFEAIGFGQQFRFFTGVVEIAGAVLLMIPAGRFVGSLVLGATMVGAVVTHLAIGGSAVPALVLGALLSLAAWLQRPRVAIASGRTK